MTEHSRTEAHMLGMIRWNAFKRKALDTALEKPDYAAQAAKERERQNNREIISRLIDIILYLAKQGMAFRGDNESLSSSSKGNF